MSNVSFTLLQDNLKKRDSRISDCNGHLENQCHDFYQAEVTPSKKHSPNKTMLKETSYVHRQLQEGMPTPSEPSADRVIAP